MRPSKTRSAPSLTAASRPLALEVENDSARHAGHAPPDPPPEDAGAGGRRGGERPTHFNVSIIVSAAFAGMSRLARQRLVLHEVLKDELAGPVHALSHPGEGAGE